MVTSFMIIVLELIAIASGVWFLWCWTEHDEIQLVPLAIFVLLMVFVAFR